MRKNLLSFWFALVSIVVFSGITSIYAYLNIFSGEFSTESSEWSDFGGYIGGVLGPLISFCTLLAVLKTVYLQRELLDAQKSEFIAIGKLQEDQLVLAKSDSSKNEIRAYQTSQINLLEMFVEQRLRVVEGLEAQKLEVKGAQMTFDSRRSELSDLDKKLTKAQDSANSLLILAFEISTTQYTDVNTIKKSLATKLSKILDLKVSE